MTQQKQEWPLSASEAFSADAVADFLEGNPDFFEHHPTLLMNLKLVHPTQGGTVSLLERQVSVLRKKTFDLERRLKDLISVAKANDQLTEKIHRLSLRLLAAGSPADRLRALEVALRTEFQAQQAVLVVFSEREAPEWAGRFVRRIPREDPKLQPFATFLKTSTPRCGQVRDAQRSFVFGPDAEEVGSVAMVPLGEECALGFLVIGNEDREHFHPGKSIDLLKRLGELVTEVLRWDLEYESAPIQEAKDEG